MRNPATIKQTNLLFFADFEQSRNQFFGGNRNFLHISDFNTKNDVWSLGFGLWFLKILSKISEINKTQDQKPKTQDQKPKTEDNFTSHKICFSVICEHLSFPKS